MLLGVLQCRVQSFCTTVPCDAVCYNVVQSKYLATNAGVASMGNSTVWCSVLQCVAACCSMLQRVVVGYSVLQCVAWCVAVCCVVCCSLVYSAFLLLVPYCWNCECVQLDSVLQCIAVRCRISVCVRVCVNTHTLTHTHTHIHGSLNYT